MKIEHVVMTPGMAADILNRSNGVVNRRPSQSTISKFVRSMPHWMDNGSTILLDENGLLLDGQHRLIACMESQVCFPTILVSGIRRSTFSSIDTGKPRSAIDMLTIGGEKNTSSLARALTLLWKYENNALGTGARSATNPDRDALLSLNPEIRNSVEWCGALRDIISLGLAAFLHYTGSRLNQVKTEQFLTDMRTGIGLLATSPALHFRNSLNSTSLKMFQHYAEPLANVGLQALNAFLNDKPIGRLRLLPADKMVNFKLKVIEIGKSEAA